jgi:hypothetical protein
MADLRLYRLTPPQEVGAESLCAPYHQHTLVVALHGQTIKLFNICMPPELLCRVALYYTTALLVRNVGVETKHTLPNLTKPNPTQPMGWVIFWGKILL